jgi:hypothetical protein
VVEIFCGFKLVKDFSVVFSMGFSEGFFRGVSGIVKVSKSKAMNVFVGGLGTDVSASTTSPAAALCSIGGSSFPMIRM